MFIIVLREKPNLNNYHIDLFNKYQSNIETHGELSILLLVEQITKVSYLKLSKLKIKTFLAQKILQMNSVNVLPT